MSGIKMATSQTGGCTSKVRHHFLLNPVQNLITQSNLSTVWVPSISVRVIKRSRTLGKHRNEDTAARWWDCFNSRSVSYSFDPQLKGSQPHKADKLRSRWRGQAQDDSICFKLPKKETNYKKTNKRKITKSLIQLNKFTSRNAAATSQVKSLQGCLNWVYWVKEGKQHSDGNAKARGICI